MSIFGGTPNIKQPTPTAPTPRLSDTQLRAKEEAGKTRARQGIEDQILSLGRKKKQPGVTGKLGLPGGNGNTPALA